MKVLRMLTVKNEIDILHRNIEWYSNQGIPTVAIDNGSTDGSYELLCSLSSDKLLSCQQMLTQGYQEQELLKRVHNLARLHNPDWLVLADADEFYESPVPNESFRDGLERISNEGYNLLQLHNIEFWMTEKDDLSEPDPLRRIRHYSYFDSNRYKAYPNMPGLDIATKIGHVPIFPENVPIMLCPQVFISRHYKFRSLNQGYQKIKQVAPTQEHRDQNFHYVQFREESQFFIIPSSRLTYYDEDKKWIIERKFDGGRMTREQMMEYLGMQDEAQLNAWFASRSLKK